MNDMQKTMRSLMGQIVRVEAIYERKKEIRTSKDRLLGTYRFWERKTIYPRSGWVVGFRFLYGGYVRHPLGSNGKFEPLERVRCALVTFWHDMNPVRVPMGDFKPGIGTPQRSKFHWTDKARDAQREYMKDMPRDAMGRFLKRPKKTEEE